MTAPARILVLVFLVVGVHAQVLEVKPDRNAIVNAGPNGNAAQVAVLPPSTRVIKLGEAPLYCSMPTSGVITRWICMGSLMMGGGAGIPLWVDIIVKLTPAFIALVVGLIASLVAYLQHKTNHDKLRLDLFSKRLEAYEMLQKCFEGILRDGRVEDQTLMLLAETRNKSIFLFDSDIEKYFNELWKRATDMRSLYLRMYGPNSLPVGAERSSVCDQESALLRLWLEDMKTLHTRYAPYLRFKQRRRPA